MLVIVYVFSDFVVYACECMLCSDQVLMYVCDMNSHPCEYEVV